MHDNEASVATQRDYGQIWRARLPTSNMTLAPAALRKVKPRKAGWGRADRQWQQRRCRRRFFEKICNL